MFRVRVPRRLERLFGAPEGWRIDEWLAGRWHLRCEGLTHERAMELMETWEAEPPHTMSNHLWEVPYHGR